MTETRTAELTGEETSVRTEQETEKWTSEETTEGGSAAGAAEATDFTGIMSVKDLWAQAALAAEAAAVSDGETDIQKQTAAPKTKTENADTAVTEKRKSE